MISNNALLLYRRTLLLLIVTMAFMSSVHAAPIPVILDTDIGDDIDDTWALSFILCSPELDLKMVVTDSHNTAARAKIVAKFLESVSRDDIPIGIGSKQDDNIGPQAKWAEEYELTKYYSTIHQDGVQAMIDLIMSSKEKITLIVIGPCPNIQEAIKREPAIIDKVRVCAMSGSVKIGYGGVLSPDAEYNVRDNVPASQAMYGAGWDIAIAPLDTAGLVAIRGEKYLQLFHDPNPVIETLMMNYREWVKQGKHQIDPSVRSSTLFDVVAAYMAFSEELCVVDDLNLKVENKGYTVVDPKAKKVRAAVKWKDLGKFEDLVVQRLKKGVAYPFSKPEKAFQ
ncbi:MAG: nucleoside hydrolase [Candidatus Omnitrophota bacterium]